MSASQWTVTIKTPAGPLNFDLRRMSKDERRQFHATFMGAYRTVNPYRPRQGANT